jgi:hypothetical protein
MLCCVKTRTHAHTHTHTHDQDIVKSYVCLYCCTVHFDNVKISFTNKFTLY